MIMMDSDDTTPYMSLINTMIRPPLSSVPYIENEYPRAILTCHPNSHPFNDRTLNVSTPIKIGRAVNKCKASNNNAIFDCKVLSRNHALIWYEQGKFYLQDTKSSNGTFVNKDRLSVANTDSAPREIYSSDIVQFGVDVTENNRKVTHGCIIATLTLYHPTGDEATNNNCERMNASNTGRDSGGNCDFYNHNLSGSQITITTGQLIQLSAHLKEAVKREESLEGKIQSLEAVLNKTSQTSAESWRSCVEEDRLLSRIEALQLKLESLLTAFSTKTDDETVTYLKNQVIKLHDLKEKYESEAKESVLLAQQSLCVARSEIGELEVSLASVQDECERLTSINLGLSEQLTRLSEKYDSLISDLEEMEQKVKASEEHSLNQSVEFMYEKRTLTSGFEEQMKSLNEKIDCLESEISRLRNLLDESNRMDSLRNLSNKMNHSRPISPLVIDVIDVVDVVDDNRNGSENESFLSPPLNGDHGVVTNNLTNGSIIALNDNQSYSSENPSKKSLNESNLHPLSSPLPQQQQQQSLLPQQQQQQSLLPQQQQSPSSPNITSQLKCEINLLKEKLDESRTARQEAESRVETLELEVKKVKSDAFHAKEDGKKSTELLVQAKEKIEATNKTIETLLKELNNVQGQLKLSRDEVNNLHQTLNRERMKSSSLLQASSDKNKVDTVDAERLDLLSQVDDLKSELDSVKEQLLKVQAQNQEQEDEPDYGPKTLVFEDSSPVTEKELIEKENELLQMKQKYDEIELKSTKLEEQVGALKEDLELANYQNKIAFTCASVPLLMLLLAIFAAFYPFFSSVTGTHDHSGDL